MNNHNNDHIILCMRIKLITTLTQPYSVSVRACACVCDTFSNAVGVLWKWQRPGRMDVAC